MEADLVDYNHLEHKKMPVFLKVLCILTFIGSGFGTLSGLYSMATHNITTKTLEQSDKAFDAMEDMENVPKAFGDLKGDMKGVVNATKKYGMIIAVCNFCASLICLFGALLMWKLKKIGFYTYILGIIISVIPSILFMNAVSGAGIMGVAIYGGMIFTVLLAVVFVVLYALNYKHLTN
jgi:hypothetical protein